MKSGVANGKQQTADDQSTPRGYVTLTGISVSLICLTLHLLVFVLTPRLRNLASTNLASLCASLLLFYWSFIASSFVDPPCRALAVIIHYSLLATFCWMTVISFDVWNAIRLSVSEIRVSAGQHWRRFCTYSTISWITPLIILAAALMVEFHAGDSNFRPGYGVINCWMQNRAALLVFVVAPLCTVMLLNIALFSCSSYLIYHTKSKMAEASTARTDFSIFTRLAVIMGLTWTTGLIAGVVQLEAVWYVFILLNTLQGLFIFVAFSCNKKIWKEMRFGRDLTGPKSSNSAPVHHSDHSRA